MRVIAAAEHSRYPVCRGRLDDVQGIVSAQALLQQSLRGEPLSMAGQAAMTVFVPRDAVHGHGIVEQFAQAMRSSCSSSNEYGEVQGVIPPCATCSGRSPASSRARPIPTPGPCAPTELALRRPDPSAELGPARREELPRKTAAATTRSLAW